MRIRLVILDSDERYLNRIVDGISSQFADTFELYMFTSAEQAVESVKQRKIDVFLASEDFDIPVKELPERCAFAYLSESSSFEEIKNENAIGKYQKISTISQEIQLLYSDSLQNKVIKKDGRVNMYLFTSPAGGVGTSVLAVAYATWLAKSGKDVLYVDLQQTGDTSLYFDGDSKHTFENVLFELQSQKKNMQYRILNMVQKSESGVGFIETPPYAATMADMSHEEKMSLIDLLLSQNRFPYVVVDMDYNVEKRFIDFIKKADRVIMVSDGSEEANTKVRRACDTLAVYDDVALDQILLVYNRFSSRYGKQLKYEDVKQGAGVNRMEGIPARDLAKSIAEKPVFSDF